MLIKFIRVIIYQLNMIIRLEKWFKINGCDLVY
nr:MAG TPA: hypothetical protein [Caudoviricetes sp.]DAU59335.1 MAG TPA: hypothetical protein [Crassvirales sp.]